jgi:hypothetical protein
MAAGINLAKFTFFNIENVKVKSVYPFKIMSCSQMYKHSTYVPCQSVSDE